MNYDSVADFSAFWGMIYFVILFVAVLAYALNPRAQKKFDEAARIPLNEEEIDD